MDFDLEKYGYKLLIWIVENLIKIIFGVGIIFTIAKTIFVLRAVRIFANFWIILWRNRYTKHRFFNKAEEIRNKIELLDFDVNEKQAEIIKILLRIEYDMLFNYVSEMVKFTTTPKKERVFYLLNQYETNPEVVKDYFIKQLNVLRLTSLKGLEVRGLPIEMINKYKHFRNMIYSPIDIMIHVQHLEYRFVPLMIMSFLIGMHVHFASMKPIMVNFIKSLNGDLENIKLKESDKESTLKHGII